MPLGEKVAIALGWVVGNVVSSRALGPANDALALAVPGILIGGLAAFWFHDLTFPRNE